MNHIANGCEFIAKDDMIVAYVRKEKRDFEPQTTAWMFARMGNGGLFVDVGASTGWFSVAIAAAGFDVVAFEPNVNPFRRLLENCALNEVEIDARNQAVSDANGEASLFFNAGLPLTSGASLNKADCLRPSGEAIVKTVRLDDAITGSPKLIKVDVEGHEMAVLRGAGKLIERNRPLMVLEANTAAHVADLAAWLEPRGYTWEIADERNLLCSPKS